ncbi:MAG: GGDEF domain-containing protein [Motiliproteus sp.]
MFELIRPYRYLWLPLLLIAGLYSVTPLLSELSSPWHQLLPWTPYLLSTLILILAWRFHCSRCALITAILVLIHLWLSSAYVAVDEYRQLLLALVPLNIAIIGLLRDRSLFSTQHIVALLLFAAQISACWWLTEQQFPQLQQWLASQPASIELLPFALPYSFSVMLVQLVALLLSGFLWIRNPELLESYLVVTVGVSTWLILEPLPPQMQQALVSLNMLLWLVLLIIHSHNLAYLDELTGLPGRRALNQRLQNLGRRHSLAMLDIDHFKRFNDTYGHDIGDQVLKLVASKLRQVRMGTAYRYGGEEFCVVFAGKRRDQTLPALEELRQAIEDASLQLRSDERPKNHDQGKKMRGQISAKTQNVSVTISIGVAEREAKADTLKQADKALYKAKGKGRNCVCY